MTYVAYITDSTTGETREHRDGLEWYEHSDYLWSDGNFGCDCNRFLFFERAVGHEPLRDEESKIHCGWTRYKVVIKDESGAVLYDDDYE